jgi:hypothetical protein
MSAELCDAARPLAQPPKCAPRELIPHPAHLHQHCAHLLLLRLIAQTLADDLVQRLSGQRQ